MFEVMQEHYDTNCGVHAFHLGLHSQHAQLPAHRHTHSHTQIIDIRITNLLRGGVMMPWYLLHDDKVIVKIIGLGICVKRLKMVRLCVGLSVSRFFITLPGHKLTPSSLPNLI